MITISIKLSQINDLEYISNKYSQVYNSVGIHPHECINYKDLSIDDLLKYTKNPKCVGIGETGLDFYYENSPKKLQKDIFMIHIEAARKSNLPLIVHTRNADADTIEILQTEMKKGQFKGLIHCFSTTKELADKAIKLGLYISLAETNPSISCSKVTFLKLGSKFDGKYTPTSIVGFPFSRSELISAISIVSTIDHFTESIFDSRPKQPKKYAKNKITNRFKNIVK